MCMTLYARTLSRRPRERTQPKPRPPLSRTFAPVLIVSNTDLMHSNAGLLRLKSSVRVMMLPVHGSTPNLLVFHQTARPSSNPTNHHPPPYPKNPKNHLN